MGIHSNGIKVTPSLCEMVRSDDLDRSSDMDKYRTYCIQDAIQHLDKAKEALEEGLKDPKKWYEDAKINAIIFNKLMPAMMYLQQEESRKRRPVAEEN